MRLIAATLVPTLMLGMVDLTLRAAGYGYSKTFFLKSEIQGEEIRWRFFFCLLFLLCMYSCYPIS